MIHYSRMKLQKRPGASLQLPSLAPSKSPKVHIADLVGLLADLLRVVGASVTPRFPLALLLVGLPPPSIAFTVRPFSS